MLTLVCSAIAAFAHHPTIQTDWTDVLSKIQSKIGAIHNAAQLTSAVKRTFQAEQMGLSVPNAAFNLAGSKYLVISIANDQGSLDGISVLASPSGSGYRLQQLMLLDDNSFMPTSGFVWRKDIVLGGLIGWYGNGPSAAAAVFSPIPNGWNKGNVVSTDFEAWDCQFKRSGSRWIANVVGRTYPKNISVAHVMANVGMSQRFTFNQGKLSSSPAVRTMNPMAVLDDIAGAAADGHFALIRKDCATAALAQRISKLGKGICDSHWDTPSNTKSTSDNQYIASSLGLQFNFVKRGGRWVLGSLKTVPKSD